MDRLCKLCGSSMIPKVKWQEYCSEKCRHLAWAKRQLSNLKHRKGKSECKREENKSTAISSS